MRLQEFKDNESGTVIYHLCPDGEPAISLARIKQDGDRWLINYAWREENLIKGIDLDKVTEIVKQKVWGWMNIQDPFAAIHGSWS